MKRSLILSALVAVAAAMPVSCTVEPLDVGKSSEKIKLNVTLNAEMPDPYGKTGTKAYLEQTSETSYSPRWENGDEIVVVIGTVEQAFENDELAVGFLYNVNDTGEKGVFKGDYYVNPGYYGKNQMVRAFYPASSFTGLIWSQTPGPGWLWGIDLPAYQNPGLGYTVDPNAYILISDPSYRKDIDGNEVVLDDMKFGAPLCLVELEIRGEAVGERIRSVDFIVEGKSIAGTIYSYEDGTLYHANDEGTDMIHVDYGDRGFIIGDTGTDGYIQTVNFTTLPFRINEGVNIHIEVLTDQARYYVEKAFDESVYFQSGTLKRIVFDTQREQRQDPGYTETYTYRRAEAIEAGHSYILAGGGEFSSSLPEYASGLLQVPVPATQPYVSSDFFETQEVEIKDGEIVLGSRDNEMVIDRPAHWNGDDSAYTIKCASTGKFYSLWNHKFRFSARETASCSWQFTQDWDDDDQVQYYIYGDEYEALSIYDTTIRPGDATPFYLFEYAGVTEKADQTISFKKDVTGENISNLNVNIIENGALPVHLYGAVTPLHFTSSDESVAVVDENGEIWLKGPGYAIITARAEEGTFYHENTASLTILAEPYAMADGWYYHWAGEWGFWNNGLVLISPNSIDVPGLPSIYDLSGNVETPDDVVINGVSFPVTGIGENAFAQVTGITNVKVGANVKTIYPGAFYGCESLATLDLPCNLRIFGGDINNPVITESKLSRISFYDGTPVYFKLNERGDLYSEGGDVLYRCVYDKYDSNVVIAEGTQVVISGAFDNWKCDSITVPASVSIWGFKNPFVTDKMTVSWTFNDFKEAFADHIPDMPGLDLSDTELVVYCASNEEAAAYKAYDAQMRGNANWFKKMTVHNSIGGGTTPLDDEGDFEW